MLELLESDLALIREVLRRHLPGRRVIAFGSRVTGKARRYSDLDLCVMGDQPVEGSALAHLRDELEESPLPISVDVIEWATTQDYFRKIIVSQPQVEIQA